MSWSAAQSIKPPNPLDKFVVPKSTPLSIKVDHKVEGENLENHPDRTYQAPVNLTSEAEILVKKEEADSENIQRVRKKRPSTSASQSVICETRKRNKVATTGVIDTSPGGTSVPNKEIKYENSSPQQLSSQVQDVSIPTNAQEEIIPNYKEVTGNDSVVSLKSLLEKYDALKLNEIGVPVGDPEPIADGSATYIPDWSLTCGCLFESDKECLDFMFHAIPPGKRSTVSKEPNKIIIGSLMRHLIGTISAGSELISRVQFYEEGVKEGSDILTKIASQLKDNSVEGLTNLKAAHAQEVEDLEKRLHCCAVVDKIKTSELGTLRMQVEKLKEEQKIWKRDEAFLNMQLLLEKERCTELEGDLFSAQKEVHFLKYSLGDKESELAAERGKLAELSSKNDTLFRENQCLKLDVERQISQKKKCISKLVPQVVGLVMCCKEFITPYRHVIKVGMERGFQSALAKLHSQGHFGDIPLESVPDFDPSPDDRYHDALVALDHITLPFIDKVASSSHLDVEDLLLLKP